MPSLEQNLTCKVAPKPAVHLHCDICRILAMEEKPPMQKQSFAYILGWSQEKIAGQAHKYTP